MEVEVEEVVGSQPSVKALRKVVREILCAVGDLNSMTVGTVIERVLEKLHVEISEQISVNIRNLVIEWLDENLDPKPTKPGNSHSKRTIAIPKSILPVQKSICKEASSSTASSARSSPLNKSPLKSVRRIKTLWLSDPIIEFCRLGDVPRAKHQLCEVRQHVIAYAKEHGLQEGLRIRLDDQLQRIMPKRSVSFKLSDLYKIIKQERHYSYWMMDADEANKTPNQSPNTSQPTSGQATTEAAAPRTSDAMDVDGEDDVEVIEELQ